MQTPRSQTFRPSQRRVALLLAAILAATSTTATAAAPDAHSDAVLGAVPAAAPAAVRLAARVAPPPVAPRALYDNLPRFTFYAHRGAGALEQPDNALSSLRAGLRDPSVTVVDVDVRPLANGTLVLMHDETVNRTTSSTGKVSSFTAARWARVRLDPNRWFARGHASEPAPTFEEALDIAGGRKLLEIEAKDPSVARRLIAAVTARGLTEAVVVNTADLAVARQVHAAGLHAQYYLTARQLARTSARTLRTWPSFVDVLGVDIRSSDRDIRRALRAGFEHVWPYTISTRAELARVKRLGANGAVIDAPHYVTRASSVYPARPVQAREVKTSVSRSAMTVRATVRNQATNRATQGVRVTVRFAGHVRTALSDVGGRVEVRFPRAAHEGARRVTLTTRTGSRGEVRWVGAT
ncbi:MAG: glycerophosphodiester phosphodiesterase family protein, partial [Brevundimonas sp.]